MAAQTYHYIQATSLTALKVAVNAYLTANATYRVVGGPIFEQGAGMYTQAVANQYAIV